MHGSILRFGDIITASLFPVSRNHTLGVLAGQNMIDEQATEVLFEGKIPLKCLNKYVMNMIFTVRQLTLFTIQ